MLVTFINSNPLNFSSDRALITIATHHAHIRQIRRHTATKVAARKRKAQILSFVESINTSPSTDSIVSIQQIGSFRDDPFWTLPVEDCHDAYAGFDYHFQVTCPLALSVGDFTPVQHGILRLCILETAMLCSAFITFNLAIKSLHRGRSNHLARAALYHANEAIVGVRKELMDPSTGKSDVMLATIFALALASRILHDYTAFLTHVEGVRRIVALRGGLDHLGMGGLLKTAAIRMFESAAVLERQRNESAPDHFSGMVPRTNDFGLDTPSLLPPEALPIRISQYPVGIARLAMNARLSVQLMKFFHTFFDWLNTTKMMSNQAVESEKSMITLEHELLAFSGSSIVELVLIVAIQAYLNWVRHTEGYGSNRSSEDEVEIRVGVLARSQSRILDGVGDDDVVDAVAWASLMIRETVAAGSGPWRWADRQVSKMGVGNDESRRRLEGLFFARAVVALGGDSS